MINSKGVIIKYGDVAPGAKENFTTQVDGQIAYYSNLDLFKEYNVDYKYFSNPCELYETPLNGRPVLFPNKPYDHNFGIWSNEVSDQNGDFSKPLVMILTSKGQYSSQGITIKFDLDNDIYAKEVNIKWLRVTDDGEEKLAEETYTPNTAEYFCQNKINNYNKIIITLTGVNMPYHRLKIRTIDYGYGTYFSGNELRNVKVIQSLDPISSELQINTVDFTLDSKSSVEYSFQQRQPLEVYFNDDLISYAYVKNANRKSAKLWDIQSDDFIGIMDSIPFIGGMYKDKNAVELINEISTAAKINFSIESGFEEKTVSGHIPYTSCRVALMQVAFAIGAVVDTSNSDKVKIYKLSDEISQEIPLTRTMQGQSFKTSETVTTVILKSHSYLPSANQVVLYDAAESGTGENILVVFNEPVHGFSFTGHADIAVDDNGTPLANENYAIINVYPDAISGNRTCQMIGYTYDHCTVSHKRKNPVVRADELEKIVEISEATLISETNAEERLNACYDWILKVRETNTKIVEGFTKTYKYQDAVFGKATYGEAIYGGGDITGDLVKDKPIAVGDIVKIKTEYLGDVTGRVIKTTFNLNGNILVKEVTMV